MCGRFTQQMSWSELHELYSISTVPEHTTLPARFNGAPTQAFAACRSNEDGVREISVLRWGLIPFWAKDVSIGSRLINARAESVHSKPSFRNAFRKRRCLIPANGWFEWATAGARKQPYFIRYESAGPISIAALWEIWDKEEQPLETFTLITTEVSGALSKIHHRQPAIIDSENWDEWLNPTTSVRSLLDLVQTPNEGPYKHYAVNTTVNNVRNNTAEILEPLRETGLFDSPN